MIGDDLTPETTDLIVVDWYDIVNVDDWNEQTESVWPAPLKTAGWLLAETEHQMLLAGTYDYQADTWSGKFVYPKTAPVYQRYGKLEVVDGGEHRELDRTGEV